MHAIIKAMKSEPTKPPQGDKALHSVHQPSITEWFAAIGDNAGADVFRRDSAQKAERLETLFQTIGLHYDRPETFAARDLTDKTATFRRILDDRGDELCSLRLNPRRPGLPHYRLRGHTLRYAYEQWFLAQGINPDDYVVQIVPHSPVLLWAATFVVRDDMIFGEIVHSGMHAQLTHGEIEGQTYRFQYDFHKWWWSEENPAVTHEVERALQAIKVVSPQKQAALKKQLGSTFLHDYLMGYFEFMVWPDDTLYFIDYNNLLLEHIATPPPRFTAKTTTATLHGATAVVGIAEGRAVIVQPEAIDVATFPDDGILVCRNTDVRYVPLMKKARAIVTEQGGILSHAAIIARELKVPCIVGCTRLLTDLHGDERIRVDATKGTVSVL